MISTAILQEKYIGKKIAFVASEYKRTEESYSYFRPEIIRDFINAKQHFFKEWKQMNAACAHSAFWIRDVKKVEAIKRIEARPGYWIFTTENGFRFKMFPYTHIKLEA